MRIWCPEYTKNIYNWTIKWLNSQLKNWKTSLNKHFTKEDMQMVNKYMRHAPYQQSLEEGKSKLHRFMATSGGSEHLIQD